MEDIEIWEDIPGYEGRYQVGCFGNVRSLNYNKTGKPKFLKYNVTKTGYAIVRLCKNGKQRAVLVSRLVCAAFHQNNVGLPCVNHIDENKLNNRADNLEWCTYSQNTLHGTHGKRMIDTRNKKRGPKAEMPVVQISPSGELVASFRSISDAAKNTGADRRKISLCCHGKRNYHFGYKWAFSDIWRGGE